MKLLTLFLALFLALTSTAKFTTRHKPKWADPNNWIRTTLTTRVTKTMPATMTAADIKDPRCKKDADCAPGTCLKGICIDGAGGSNPKHTDFMFSVDDLDKIGMGQPSRRDQHGAGKKCKTNNDCAKDKKCGKHGHCVSKKHHIGRDEQEHEPVKTLAPGEEEVIVKDLGDEFGEDDEVTEDEHAKEKRAYHISPYELPGDAYDGGKKKECANSNA
ncbi:uncharacterized protein KD926_000297 [Aspergillus affinis]|uniref:uncharacterized protein n=1 Tax=Aspergillus affinis TaxID=1070780 RepID=UPI0022FDDD1C|nr:uncharacterized protein KD926_000297 [Aspergillus affinis]KAI9037502.1 hypothetical protein KD926_000297 [Aspergillus affinis]